MDFLPLDSLVNALWSGAWLLLCTVPAVLFYGYLADGIFFEGRGRVRSGSVGEADAIVVVLLMVLFGVIVVTGFYATAHAVKQPLPSARQMMENVVTMTSIFLLIIVGFIASMAWRKIYWQEALGLRWYNPAKVVLWAALLILLTLPLIQLAQVLSQWVFNAGGRANDNSQEIVRFLAGSSDRTVRLVVAASAVLIAPVQEELIFRGFIYGVVRRYIGPVAGLLINATLFAGIHLHAPSFAGLFVLAVCLTLAYEWTGSLYVPMTMHALFNSISVVALLSGGNT